MANLNVIGGQVKLVREHNLKGDGPQKLTEEVIGAYPFTAERLLADVIDNRAGKLQKRLYNLSCHLDWANLFCSLSSKALRALMRAKTSPGSQQNHFLATMPGHRLLYANPEQMIFMVRNLLFLPLGNVDVKGDWLGSDHETGNYLRCLKLVMRARHSPHHTSVLAVLRSMLQGVGIVYRPEPSYTKVDSNNVLRRGDFAELVTREGFTTLYDYTCSNPAAGEFADEAQNVAGYTAKKLEERKVAENAQLCEREG